MVYVTVVWVVIHETGFLNDTISFQASLCGRFSLYYTKYDKNVDIMLHIHV